MQGFTPSAHAALCDWVISHRSEKSVESEKKAKWLDLDQIAERILLDMGFKKSTKKPQGKLKRFRLYLAKKKLAKKISSYQFENANYRRWWIEQVIRLNVSEYFGSAPKNEKALMRLILRRLLNEGVANLEDPNEPHLWQRTLKVARWIRHNNFFRVFIEWRKPMRHFNLTDGQMALLVQHGRQALEMDLSLKQLVRAEMREKQIQDINAAVVLAMSAYFMSVYYERFGPVVEKEIQEAYAWAQSQAYNGYSSELQSESKSVVADDPILKLAINEIKIIKSALEREERRKVNAAEFNEIKWYVCRGEYSDSLNQIQAQRCLSYSAD